MANKIDLNIDGIFSEELALMQKELNEIDDLYKETKDHFDKVRNGRSPGTLIFIQQQTGNLITMKNNKFNMVKEIMVSKKNITELRIKEFNINNKDSEDSNENVNGIAKELYTMLINNNIDDLKKNSLETDPTMAHYSDTDIDKLLEERLSEIDTNIPDTDHIDKDNDKKLKYVVDMEKNIYVVDDEYNILDDEKIPDFVIEYIGDDDNLEAVNQYGDNLEIVEFE